MSFLHISLLAGLAVAAVPVLLHMFGQQKPTEVVFPALRFVRQTRLDQSRSWQLRHWLLLLLRMLLLATLVVSLARPRVHSAMFGSMLGISGLGVLALFAAVVTLAALFSKRPKSVWLTSGLVAAILAMSSVGWGVQAFTTGPTLPTSDPSAPVAAVMIVDNGPTMAYRTQNRDRLEIAKEFGKWILERMPIESHVALVGQNPVGTLSLDPTTAKSQLKMLATQAQSVDLITSIRTAVELVIADDLERREVYVLTDMSATSWSNTSVNLNELLKQYGDEVLIQVVDVGSADATNWQLGDPELDYANVPVGSQVPIEVAVERSSGEGDASVSIEMLLEAQDPRLPLVVNGQLQVPKQSIVARETLEFKSGEASRSITVTTPPLPEGSNHLTIRLDRSDPLPIDDVRYVTIDANELTPTLVVCDDPSFARMLALLIDPSQGRNTSGDVLVESLGYAQLPQADFGKYGVICLYDPFDIPLNVAEALVRRIQFGAGLLTILGPSAQGRLEEVSADESQINPVKQLLPGTLAGTVARTRTERNVFLDPIAKSHPVFLELAPIANEIPWNRFPIFQSWDLKPKSNVVPIANLSDQSAPVIVSHTLGRGTVITLLTPIPEPETRGRTLWNELWVGDDPWPAFGLLIGIVKTLSGADSLPRNFRVGESVSLPNDDALWPTSYELYRPDAQSRRVTAAQGSLFLGNLDVPGTYHLRGNRGGPVSRGVGVNLPASNTKLRRIETTELEAIAGPGTLKVATNREEIESSVGQSRFGRELYPLLMTMVAGLFLAEQAMSNRFYKLKLASQGGL